VDLRPPARHPYELYLAADIDHTRTKTKSPHINGICERFEKTLLNEFYRVPRLYRFLDLQRDLDEFLEDSTVHPHQGR
jgi:transposase InsO family protein